MKRGDVKIRIGFGAVALLAAGMFACSSSDNPITGLINGDDLILSPAHVKSLDSTGQVIEQANPASRSIQSLVDSTLLILTAGVVAHRTDVTTDLTTKPLFFVGVHRVFNRSGLQPSATWNIIGMDDPSKLTSIVEFSGFAVGTGGVAPESVTGTVGDGTGVVNGELIQIGSNGAATEWMASSGSVTITSLNGTTPCPGFTNTPKVSCTLETVRTHFTLKSTGAGGATGGRQATLATDATIPTMRLTYTP